jgi:cyclophilin family peptidyl-prolyl cis-trans isomerase
MVASQQARRRFGGLKSKMKKTALVCAIDALERRQLFSGETASAIPGLLANTTTPSANSITLSNYFSDSTLPGTLVTFKTNLGTITVALTDAATPLTVANFLSYVNSGAYTNTIFHRTAVLAANTGGSPKTPADIIQGGGYKVAGASFKHIPTSAPVADEYTKAILNDSTGTLAMAKTGAANSATSEWYFNVHNNVSALDTPNNASGGALTSYTAFGTVLTGMNVVDQIAALPTYNVSSSLGITTVPVLGLTTGQATKNRPITSANLVYTESVTSQPGTTYVVTSDNNSLVTPKVTDGVLSFTYASGKFGTANITILAKNLDGTSASQSLTVTVPNSATPSAGPTAAAVTAPNVVTGTATSVNVLGSATDSVAALNKSSVAIVTQPAHGTATVNTSTGAITYTPTAGYTGSDTLSYTIADTAGTVSSAAAVTLNVVAKPVSITIGTAGAKSLTFTQPSGAVGHLSIGGGTAVVTFAGSSLTQTTSAGVVTVSGADATIASVVITNKSAAASLSLTSTGAVTLGSVTDNGAVSILNAPNATLTGDSSFKSINRLVAAAAANADLSLGSGTSTTLTIPNVTNTSVSNTGAIASITSTQWINSDGGFYALNAPQIGRLKVTGAFADQLSLSGTGISINSAAVGQASAAWTLSGAVNAATLASPASTWSLTAAGRIGTLNIAGNLASNITALTIGSFTVTGTTTGSNIDTTAASSATQTTLGRVKFGGAVASSNVSTGGNITSLTAPSLATASITSNKLNSLIVTGATTGLTLRTTAAATSKIELPLLRFGGAVASSSLSTAGSIGKIFAGSMTSTQIASATISSIDVTGAVAGGTITTSQAFSKNKLEIGRLSIGGDLGTTTITSVGNIGAITAASVTGSHIYAGVSSTISQGLGLPASTSDFAANARIASVTLGKATTAFSSSFITAENLGPLHLGNVASSNGGVPFGIAAHKITAATATLVPGGTINAGAAQLKSATTLSAYETAKKITLGDFKLELL